MLVTALSNVKLLTTTVMVDNLAEKVDECPLNWGCQVIVCIKLGRGGGGGDLSTNSCPINNGVSFLPVKLSILSIL